MIPDISPPVGVWTDLYQATGFTAGTRLMIQNKSMIKALIWEGDAPPPNTGGDNKHGFELANNGDAGKTTAGITGCWALFYEAGYVTNGRLCVQVYTP